VEAILRLAVEPARPAWRKNLTPIQRTRYLRERPKIATLDRVAERGVPTGNLQLLTPAPAGIKSMKMNLTQKQFPLKRAASKKQFPVNFQKPITVWWNRI